jgi:hypothetical protein
MPAPSARQLAKFCSLAVLALAGFALSPVFGDDHTLIEDAHHQLEKALNPGGDPPSDADRTALLQATLEDLKNLPHYYRGKRVEAMACIKSALLELKNGGSAEQVSEDIREADSDVRDMEAR